MAASDRDADADYLRFFPKPSPYENQREAMDRIRDAIADERDVLFEGACGTGKTLASLAPALEYAREEDKTVVITTNVHQQMRQFVRDAREIHAGEPIRAVVFRGKGSMCHIDVDYQECQVLRDNTYEVADTERDKRQLERQQEELLDAAREGDDDAADARSAVMDELESLDEELEELREQNVCERYYNNLTEESDEFVSWLYDDVRTPDDVYDYAEENDLCGYELLKESMEGVDLAVCNYHHLLDPGIRAQFFRWLDRDPEDVVVVFDEAHNVEDAARDHASRALTENTLDEAMSELAGETETDARAEYAENVLGAFRDALVETYEAGVGPGGDGPASFEAVGENWADVPVANDGKRDDLTLAFLQAYEGRGISKDLDAALSLGEDLEEAYEDAYRNGEAATREEAQTLQAAEFVDAYLTDGDALGQYPTAAVRRDAGTGEVYGRAELYTCIPRDVTADLFDAVHASVLMSATLRPFDVTGEILGLDDPVTMAYGLEFSEERRRTFTVDTEPLFASQRDDPEVQEEVAGVLADAARFTAGSSLFFFPSYGEAERYHDLLADEIEGARYLDEAGTPVEELRERFVADEDAVLFTSLWGTLAEGVSFEGDDARTVAVVGVPYPRLDARAEAVQDAYDEAFGSSGAGWKYAVEIPTVRKTRQALGRVIRSPDDYGVRMLVDRRYTKASRSQMRKYSVNGSFPAGERREMVDIDPGKLKFATLNFYGDVDAWGPEGPPQP
ncbi:helicase [Halarchaeum grantii]|uniref:Helicase n=1 Tax=Halarchaeum grantii TaxID=1193105 RepID=A0A830FD89_9EURY|nr:ATP-dependent DNA helicase [Halarchaeum grantii]GGL35299.1 helicase [Halarchaeum grantii]